MSSMLTAKAISLPLPRVESEPSAESLMFGSSMLTFPPMDDAE